MAEYEEVRDNEDEARDDDEGERWMTQGRSVEARGLCVTARSGGVSGWRWMAGLLGSPKRRVGARDRGQSA